MKKLLPILVFLMLILSSGQYIYSQINQVDIGIDNSDCSDLIITWTSLYNFVGSTGNLNKWTQCTFTVAWDQSLPQTVLGNLSTLAPGFTNWQKSGLVFSTGGGTQWAQEIILFNGSYVQDIPIGTTEVLNIALNLTGTGNFYLVNPNNNTGISHGLLGQQWSGTYNPATVSSYTWATKIVWNGTRWCGGSSTNYYGEPASTNSTIDCFITGPNGVLHESNAQVNNLTVNSGADLTIAVNASLLSDQLITVNSANGLNIAANATGTGSFISKTGGGTGFTYGTGASSTVNQYFTDNVTSVPFHVHLVGPLVNDPTYQTANGHLGVYLGAFNLVNSMTYAYVFDNTQTNPWVNVVPFTYLIPTTRGLALSTTTNAPQTLSMTGKFVHGNITTANGSTVQNAGWNLISNPWPSGIALEAFLTTNGVTDGNLSIYEDIYAWEGLNDAEGGNYSVYTYNSGGTGGLTDGKIRIGQGFFVEYTGTGNISFLNNSHRVHTNGILLKDEQVGLLRMKIAGNGFSDELIVHFRENAENTYGIGDAEKWPSMYENATEAWTVTLDNFGLTINSLEPMDNQLVSVPMSFKCSAENSYIIEASNIESFETGTEIYLEDLKLGGDWYNLVQNPVYEFTGSSSDIQERFIIHFFGPTAIDDPENGGAELSNVRIYGYGQEAYIVNRGNETIKEYVAYDMMGRELHRGTLPNNTVNKVTIGNVSAYYIVKVITREGTVYTDKVYISK